MSSPRAEMAADIAALEAQLAALTVRFLKDVQQCLKTQENCRASIDTMEKQGSTPRISAKKYVSSILSSLREDFQDCNSPDQHLEGVMTRTTREASEEVKNKGLAARHKNGHCGGNGSGYPRERSNQSRFQGKGAFIYRC